MRLKTDDGGRRGRRSVNWPDSTITCDTQPGPRGTIMDKSVCAGNNGTLPWTVTRKTSISPHMINVALHVLSVNWYYKVVHRWIYVCMCVYVLCMCVCVKEINLHMDICGYETIYIIYSSLEHPSRPTILCDTRHHLRPMEMKIGRNKTLWYLP